MEFLYPKFDKVTHSIKSSNGISIKYPKFKTSSRDKDYSVAEGVSVVLIRENVGYNNEWSLVKVIDNSVISAEYYNKQFYILSNNLENIGPKESYVPDKTTFLQIDPDAAEINPIYQEIFIPYIDPRNGLFSVRVQVDYERILDLKMFEKVLEEVYLEGVNILLAARGFKSDNSTISFLREKYYCFGYINRDLDQTTRRPCEPLTFTVSIPLNFFNDDTEIKQSFTPVSVNQRVTFTSNNFVTNIEILIAILSQKAPGISRITYPNKAIENFLLDFEINGLRGFAVAANEIMSLANSPIEQTREQTTSYDIGLDRNLDVASVNIKKYNQNGELTEEIDFAEGLLAQCRLRGEFNNKRVFNYLININGMVQNSNTEDTLAFLTEYVKYPSIRLIDEFVQIDDIIIPPEDVAEFRMTFEKDSESCVNVSDIINLANQASLTAQNLSSIGHMFAAKDPANAINSLSAGKEIKNNLSSIQTEIKKQQVSKSTGINIVAIGKWIKETSYAVGSNIADISQQAGLASVDITKQVGGMFAEEFKFEMNYKTNLNTLCYIAKRLNLQEIIFQKIFCWLKGTNPNAENVAELLSELPFEVYNYFRFLKQRDLKGVDYIKALEEGVSFEAQLICNDEVAYFIKGLVKFLTTTNVVLSRTISFVNQLEETIKRLKLLGKGNNPYDLIIKSVSKTLYTALTNFIFEYLRDCLLTDCDEPILDGDVDNFYDPYSTHHPFERFGNTENNNAEQIRKNRLKALEETVPDIVNNLTFGPDVEYTIDLIGRLIKDINCILTLSENLDLLKGAPSDEVVVLIKNIIRNKYSKDPNNLTYLLNTDKLKLFFAKLGLKVDPEYIEKLSDPVIELIKKNGLDVCTPEQFEVRSSILNNKIPKELDVLADDSRRRVEKARELIEKLKNNEVVYNISALCPDVEDADINEFKNYLFEQYNDSVITTFTNTLTLFNEEASKVPDKYTEEKQFVRKDYDGNIIGTYPYNTYNSNLHNNLYAPDAAANLQPGGIVTPPRGDEEGQTYNFSYFYKNELPLSNDELTDILLGSYSSEIATIDKCSKDAALLETDIIFKKLIDEGKVLYERRPEYVSAEDYAKVLAYAAAAGLLTGGISGLVAGGMISLSTLAIIDLANRLGIDISILQKSRNWDSISETMVSRGTEESEFSKELKQESMELYEYIKEKKYVVFVDSENLRDSDKKAYGEVNFRLVYYSPFAAGGAGDFILLKRVQLKYNEDEEVNSDNNVATDETDFGLSTYTGEWNSRMEYDKLSDLKISNREDFYKNFYPLIKNFYREEDNEDTDSFYTVRTLASNFIPSPPEFNEDARETIKIITGASNPALLYNVVQTSIVQLTADIVDKILILEKTLGSLENLNKYGLFYISNNLDFKERIVKVSTTSAEGSLEYKPFYANILKLSDESSDHIKSVDSLTYTYLDGEEVSILEVGGYQYGIKSLYNYFLSEIQNLYTKNILSPNEFIFFNQNETSGSDDYGPFVYDDMNSFMEKASKDPWFESPWEMNLNPDFKDIKREEYQKIAAMNYEQNIIYSLCNLYPHYLNLQYFLSSYIDMYKPLLCDDNLPDIPVRILDAVLTRFTIRTYITDQLTKVIPFLSTLDLDDLNKLHLEQFVVDVMREHMRAEMQVFTSNTNFTDSKSYYLKFVERKVKKLFKDDLDNGKITEFYVLDTSLEENKEIDYYIRKEIRHFIKFAISKGMFNIRNISLYKEDLSKFIDLSTVFSRKVVEENIVFEDQIGFAPREGKRGAEYYLTKLFENTQYFREEYYNILLYLLMTSTVDVQKRNLFSGTKSELARLFFENINSLSEPEDKNLYEEKPDEDIINFITKIGFSNNPAALATLNPDYSKYISFFLEAALEETRSILLNSSMFIDKNITITRTINYVLSTISSLSWSFMDQKTRDKLIADAAVNNRPLALLYKRAESAMSPIPDALTSIGLCFTPAGLPDKIGRYYLMFDTIKEIIWAEKTNQQLSDLAASIAEQNNKDVCEVTTPDAQDVLEECTVEKRDKLLAEFNKLEEE